MFCYIIVHDNFKKVFFDNHINKSFQETRCAFEILLKMFILLEENISLTEKIGYFKFSVYGRNKENFSNA